ncbi:acetyl-CoA carboxylase biotin carboxyl carrier protein [Ochrobactrum sp. EDr1-4]|uniref:acetyl-CoA carboxylase biotin carboxyl carrier protein n=1 Tax=Ochrobactrum sp. EDr1-4 TaxID=3368622 RepID=UPI003B9FD904
MSKDAKHPANGIVDDFTSLEVLEQITCWLQQAGVSEVEIETDTGESISISLQASGKISRSESASQAQPIVAVPLKTSGAKAPLAPCVGRFVERHPYYSDGPFAAGTTIRAGEIVGFVKTGPLLVASRSVQDVIVTDILVKAGDLVGFGDPLFKVEPTS